MFSTITSNFAYLMQTGGLAMWPLLILSCVGLALAIERCWFWVSTNNPKRIAKVREAARLLRKNDHQGALKLLQSDNSVYSRVVHRLVQDGRSDAVITDVIESQRPRLERFMPTLSTIITAAPMLGILGTVMGIIYSFEILSNQMATTDPRAVSRGIGEALITTAAGLTIALVVLFPYNAFRAQIDRTLSRVESLIAAAGGDVGEKHVKPPQSGSE